MLDIVSKLLTVIRYFFNFKKPEFTEIDFIDLVIDERPIFLLVWKSRHAHLLKIKSYRSYRQSKGSIILLLASTADHLTIRLKNVWRSLKLEVKILHIQLDGQTASLLLQRIKEIRPDGQVEWNSPLSTVDLHLKGIFIRRHLASVNNKTPVLQKGAAKLKAVQPIIKRQPILQTEKFKYTKTDESL